MKLFLTAAATVLAVITASTTVHAATVDYQHPDVSIVAVDESLESVLHSLSKEMAFTVTAPADLNPVINCNIQG